MIPRKPNSPLRYMRCACCDRYAHERSLRQWCGGCEDEFAAVLETLRKRA